MLIDSVPKQSVQQLFKVAGLTEHDRVYVCGSGKFSIERALREKMPGLWISGNDASLLSCALGCWMSGQSLAFRFAGDLRFLEEVTPNENFRWRVAALIFALDYSKFLGKNLFAIKQREAMERDVTRILQAVYNKLAGAAEIKIDDFYAGDFRDQASRGLESGGVILLSSPTCKNKGKSYGEYTRSNKALMNHVVWDPPDNRKWDEAKLPELLHSWDRAHGRYYVYCDHPLEGFNLMAKFERVRGRTVWLYGNHGNKSSLRAMTPRIRPLLYQAIQPELLTAESLVRIVEAEENDFDFLRVRYLSRLIDIAHAEKRFLVLLDGNLAGGIAYRRSEYGAITDLYLLSDFSIVRAGRISKLIALLATSRELTRHMDRVYGRRFTHILTTAFTDKPVSMKYRGIFEVSSRKPGRINYVSEIRQEPAQHLYKAWWNRYAKNPR